MPKWIGCSSRSMPDVLVVVAGTGTEIGKTWVTAHVAAALRASGVRVAARKPAQSFAPDDPPDSLDAAVLAAATGERADDVCLPHRSYEVPMAPPMAAAALGRPAIMLGALLDELTWPDGIEVGFVETAGGIRSPIASDADNAQLARALDPGFVLLVADAGLGTINLVRLSVDALAGLRVLVVLNRFDATIELHERNRAWLADVDGLDVVTDVGGIVSEVDAVLRGVRSRG
jgi:dethiobiotin synthetase